jgi:transmembrane sensor
MLKDQRLKTLFIHYINGTSSNEEEREFMKLVNDGAYDDISATLMDEYPSERILWINMDESQKRNVLNKIFQNEPNFIPSKKKKPVLLSLKPFLAAAVLFLVVSVGAYFVFQQRSNAIKYSKYQGKLAPGRNTATLTLANGEKISLPNMSIGHVFAQAGIKIKKTADGQLLYELDQPRTSDLKNTDRAIQFNTITTPAGGQYQVVLMDGTHVWLNSSSSLHYPITGFKLGERKVELTGEAYFEVAKISNGKAHVPFVVQSKGQQVEVLGTHFNIKSYNDEELTTTTLLEGRVKVSRPGAFNQVLHPGEQAQVKQTLKIINVDTSTTVAWKNGLFKFENATLQDVMLQFSRWYDVDVEYEGKIPHHKFRGEIYRDMDAAKAFKILSYADIKLRIEAPIDKQGRKKIVIYSN